MVLLKLKTTGEFMTEYIQERERDTEHRDDDIRNFYWIYKIKLIAEETDKYNIEKYLNEMGTAGWECFSISQLHKETEKEDPFIRYHFKKRMDKRYKLN